MAVASGEGQIVKGLSGVLTTVAVTAPITGDGTAGNPVGISAATDLAAGSLSAADKTKLDGLPASAVPTTRDVNTTAPLTGGGALSGDLTLGISAATDLAAGSLSAADKTKLDGLAVTGATYWAQKAAAALGTTADQMLFRFFDLDEGGDLRVSNSGTVSGAAAVTTLDGGWYTATAGDGTATGNNQIKAAALPGNIAPIQVVDFRNSKWCAFLRWKTTTVPGATGRSGLRSQSTALIAGIYKANNATKFSLACGSVSLASTHAIDTAVHELFCGNDGTSAFLSVDGEANVTAAKAGLSTGTPDEFGVEVFAGALEAAQTYQVDFWGFATVRS